MHNGPDMHFSSFTICGIVSDLFAPLHLPLSPLSARATSLLGGSTCLTFSINCIFHGNSCKQAGNLHLTWFHSFSFRISWRTFLRNMPDIYPIPYAIDPMHMVRVCVCVLGGTSYELQELQTWQSLLYIAIATQCAPSCCCCLVDVAVVNADNVACNCLWLLATSIGDRTVRTVERTDSAAARRVLNLIINLRFFAIFTTRFVYIWPDARLRYCCTIADPLAPSTPLPPHFGSYWSININWKGFIL